MAGNYDVGDAVRCRVEFKDTSDSFIDPTTVTFKLKLPSGSTTTYVYGTDAQLVKDSTGKYHVDVDISSAGIYYYRFIGTGTVKAAGESKFSIKTSNF